MAGYNTKVFFEQGGEELVVDDGGKITVRLGGSIDIDGEGELVAVEFDEDFFEVNKGEVTLKESVAALLEIIADIPTADPEDDGETIWNDKGVLKVSGPSKGG